MKIDEEMLILDLQWPNPGHTRKYVLVQDWFNELFIQYFVAFSEFMNSTTKKCECGCDYQKLRCGA